MRVLIAEDGFTSCMMRAAMLKSGDLILILTVRGEKGNILERLEVGPEC